VRISNHAVELDEFLLYGEPGLASNPGPRNFATDVSPEIILSWSPADSALSHDVYLGTNLDDVNNGTGGTFKGNREPNSYEPPQPLDFESTYYWRIDEVTGTGTVKGYVWRFTTDTGKAGQPSPPDASSGVSGDVVLSWDSGALAAAHEVYFGTDFDSVYNAVDPNTLPGMGRLDFNSFDPPGRLASNTTYYWRIDEVGNGGLVRGDVWSFKVVEVYTNSLGMELVWIEPGSFQMGSENGDFDEVPVHNVTISTGFWLGRYEVSNAQYEQFDPGHSLVDHRGFSHEPNEAVIFVSWYDANSFCDWLSQREGVNYRLPTEAEWEYACRAGTTTNYHTGDTLGSEFLKNAEQTWGPEPVPLYVGQTTPNPWGLYDMHGNVEEWCAYETGNQTDPVGRINGRFRVCRGGSHSTTVEYLRSANRMGTLPQDKHWLIGFRVVLGQTPATEPLPEVGPELYQTDVNQTVPPDGPT